MIPIGLPQYDTLKALSKDHFVHKKVRRTNGGRRSKKTACQWRIKGDLWLLPNKKDAKVFYSRTFIHSRKRTSRSSRIRLAHPEPYLAANFRGLG